MHPEPLSFVCISLLKEIYKMIKNRLVQRLTLTRLSSRSVMRFPPLITFCLWFLEMICLSRYFDFMLPHQKGLVWFAAVRIYTEIPQAYFDYFHFSFFKFFYIYIYFNLFWLILHCLNTLTS